MITVAHSLHRTSYKCVANNTLLKQLVFENGVAVSGKQLLAASLREVLAVRFRGDREWINQPAESDARPLSQ